MKKRISGVCCVAASAVKGYFANRSSMHAAGLTYFSLLSIVPVLCVLLLAAKILHVDDYVRARMNERIELAIANIERGQDDSLAAVVVPDECAREERRRVACELGARARKISNEIFDRVDSFDVGTLGWIGFIMLVWTVISSIGMVEVSFNEIWGVDRPRAFWKRAFMYLSVATVIPVLGSIAMSVPILNIVKNVIVATAGATSLTKWLSDSLVWFLDLWMLRFAFLFLLSTLNFAFMFYMMPNAKVSLPAAVRGGAATAVLFGGWMKICSVAQIGIARSSALYGSFAFFPIVLAWMYMSWQIVLFGANLVRAIELSGRSGRP